MLAVQPDDDVLDVACGSGVFLEKYAPCARRIAGIDHSDVQIGMARRRLRERIIARTAEIVRGDSAALPWADDSFSVVTCNCVGCFAQPERSVAEMRRVLRPGGRAVFAVDFYATEEQARKSGERWGLPTWTEPELEGMLDAAGFEQIRTTHAAKMTFAAAVKPG